MSESLRKALVVDNDLTAREIVSSRLLDVGISPRPFTCGKEAWKYIEKRSNNDILIVITAVRLHPGEGLTLLEKIKSHELFYKIPVIVMDNDLDPLFVHDAKRFEAHDYLQKPLSEESLKASLNRIPFLVKKTG
ncbi:MAG: response regulator [Pseudobdellovibrionaceae bacterium]